MFTQTDACDADESRSIVSSTRAFTLVELLVVIGIITVLIAILLPALGKARQSAIAIQCESNMREIGMGIIQFSQTHDGRAPGSAINTNPNTANQNIQWMEILSIEQFKKDYYVPRYQLTADSKLYCPESVMTQTPNGILNYDRCYAINLYAAGGLNSNYSSSIIYPPQGQYGLAGVPNAYDYAYGVYPYSTYYLGTKLALFQNASEKYLVTEIERAADTIVPNGKPNGTTPIDDVADYLNDPKSPFGNPSYFDPLYPAYTLVNTSNQGGLMAFRHNKRGNILFVDGHVESRGFDRYIRNAQYMRPF